MHDGLRKGYTIPDLFSSVGRRTRVTAASQRKLAYLIPLYRLRAASTRSVQFRIYRDSWRSTRETCFSSNWCLASGYRKVWWVKPGPRAPFSQTNVPVCSTSAPPSEELMEMFSFLVTRPSHGTRVAGRTAFTSTRLQQVTAPNMKNRPKRLRIWNARGFFFSPSSSAVRAESLPH